ncbi:MAG: ornithine carbamoyltransferase [Candidatus Magnetomorum sp.]|nr:ornithine carbamoyltransferase [Candidatus Magnetomorum sp.]
MEKDILNLWDLKKSDCNRLIERALTFKRDRKSLSKYRPLVGKSMGLLFEKASTRTRISFETAMNQLGGATIYLNPKDTQLSRNEPIKDTARVLSGYLDILVVRTYSQKIIEDMAAWASIPVINALTDSYHPCQILSDVMTIVEKFDTYEGLTVAWIGDGNNVANSWINISAILGLNLILACPENYMPDPEIIKKARNEGCGNIKLTTDPVQAATNADVINTDVWASMGQESQIEARKKLFKPYQVNASLVAHAKKHAAIMHCLPAHRDEEITDDILEGPNTLVWPQAENKMFMHKAVLEELLIESDR